MRRSLALLLVATSVIVSCGPAQRTPPSGPPPLDAVTVRRFGMYSFGASGVVQLPDGRIMIAEDESLHPLVIVDLFGNGRAWEFTPEEVRRAFGRHQVTLLNDLEGMTIDPRGHVYATTSHALPRNGIQTGDRQLVVRFDVRGDSLVNTNVFRGLEAALASLESSLADAERKLTKTRGPSPGLNIEGLAWDPRTNHLLFGLRGPLHNGRAIIIALENPDDVFERGAAPLLAQPVDLDLEGQGIRDISYDPDIGAFLVVAGASGMSAWGHAALWSWSGGQAAPVHLRASVLDPLKPEGVSVATVAGQRVILFVCDDGTLDTKFFKGRAPTNRGTPSRYVVLPFTTLLRDNPGLPRSPGAH